MKPPETRSRLHIPLGLSQGLKSSLTSPQLGRKAAAIALPFWAKSDVMLQSPPRRKWYIFYEVRYVRYRQPSEPKKCVSTHRSHTPNLPRSSTVVTLTILSIKLQSSGPTRGPWYLSSQTEFHPAAAVAHLSLLKRSSDAKRKVRNNCVLMIFQFFYSPFFN